MNVINSTLRKFKARIFNLLPIVIRLQLGMRLGSGVQL